MSNVQGVVVVVVVIVLIVLIIVAFVTVGSHTVLLVLNEVILVQCA